MSKSNHAMPNPYQGLTKEQVLETMRQLAADGTRNQLNMGLLYNYLVDSKLLADTKYKRPVDFICDNIHEISRAALVVYGAVARAFNQQVCARYGIYRLRYLLTYKDATQLQLNHQEPGDTVILMPQKEGGEVKPKRFSDCTVDELRLAVQHARQKPTTLIPPEHRALVDQYREAVVHRFPQGSPVRVQLRTHKGEVVVDFRSIPVLQVSKLTEALLEQFDAVPKPPEVESAEEVPRSQAQ